MQGHPDVIDYLNTLLTGELAARDQYFIHSRMYEDWGFTELYERINHEMEEEAQHADALMRRILMAPGEMAEVMLKPEQITALSGNDLTVRIDAGEGVCAWNS